MTLLGQLTLLTDWREAPGACRRTTGLHLEGRRPPRVPPLQRAEAPRGSFSTCWVGEEVETEVNRGGDRVSGEPIHWKGESMNAAAARQIYINLSWIWDGMR